MIITDDARDEFKKMFKEENAKNIRIFFDGYG
ncbi:Fe-S cluster assembly iron-binding protein IscA [Bacillus niacini]|uniref:Fe-S cluster assembly iron-binding protein IscA n=1 Tax=Neobacillus niacini TaxID=86668 RepID=A0A852TLQ8_9BACI|nr:Fe-S cluster assembly iron-binding protein IscA [Neobacillus niacini]